MKHSVCLGWAGVRDSAFVPVEIWMDQPGGSRLRRGGAEEQGGVKHLPTTAQPCCLQAGWGWPSLQRRPPYAFIFSSGDLDSCVLPPEPTSAKTSRDKATLLVTAGKPSGWDHPKLWTITLSQQSRGSKDGAGQQECDLLTFRFRRLLNCVTCSSRWTHS